MIQRSGIQGLSQAELEGIVENELGRIWASSDEDFRLYQILECWKHLRAIEPLRGISKVVAKALNEIYHRNHHNFDQRCEVPRILNLVAELNEFLSC